MERILATSITEFLINNNLISEHQFGFLKKRSTTTQLITTCEDWFDAIAENKKIDCIYVDFQKAFDSIPINLLIQKISNMGIRGKLLSWITDFLTKRTFCVKIGETISSYKNITSGVPQGSVLGPLLFLIYINDLPEVIPKDVKIKLYADDLKIYKCYKTEIDRQNLDLALLKLEQWANKSGLKIAINNTFIFYLGNKNSKTQYKINNNIITEANTIKDLGVTIDNRLTFSEYISHIIRVVYLK